MKKIEAYRLGENQYIKYVALKKEWDKALTQLNLATPAYEKASQDFKKIEDAIKKLEDETTRTQNELIKEDERDESREGNQ